MKKYMIGLIVAVFTFIAVLPTPIKAAEINETVTVTETKDGKAKVSLTMPDGAKQQISTVKITLLVEPKNTSEGTVTFTFADAIKQKAKVSEYRYSLDTSHLNIYVSGTTPLFEDGKVTIDIGTISAGSNFKVTVVEDSLTTVVGTEEEIVALDDYPEVTISDEKNPDNPTRPGDTAKKLEETIKAAEALSKNDYTEESYNALLEAIANAKRVLNDPNATNEQIAQALADLENAIGALVSVARDSAQEKFDQDVADQKIPDPANTGDTTNVWPYVTVVVLSGAIVGAFLYMKQKEKNSVKGNKS